MSGNAIRKEQEPEWLTRKVDNKLRLVLNVMGNPATLPGGAQVLMLQLTEPGPWPTDEQIDRWEFTCDGCGKYCRGLPFVNAACEREVAGSRALVVFGACVTCMNKKPKA